MIAISDLDVSRVAVEVVALMGVVAEHRYLLLARWEPQQTAEGHHLHCSKGALAVEDLGLVSVR